ncbi:MAG: serine hydrolase domain-containing protein [Lysobacterales bacterium]|jgi:hypothetical protein
MRARRQPSPRLLAAATLALCFAGQVEAGAQPKSASNEQVRTQLTADFLLGTAALEAPIPTAAYAPSDTGAGQRFEGTLELLPADGESGVRGRLKAIEDRFGYLQDATLRIDELPRFRFDLVQDGRHLIPMRRGPQPAAHPYWEFILEPGMTWRDAVDGDWSRAALPFTLEERNANCTHNGLLTFLYRPDGSVSRAAWQIGSETCMYLQIDLWGVAALRYTPHEIAQASAAVDAFRHEQAARLPVRPLAALATDFPGTDPKDFDWFPPEEVSAVGFAIDGVDYRGPCRTRYGPYPFCEVLDLPSYSLAKSIFAGLSWMILEQESPGVGNEPVVQWVPECRSARWQGVTLRHLLDMSSGNYESLEADVDEFASYETPFMGADTHAAKIGTACTLFPRKSAPGTSFAYHTSDTYIAGTLMNAWLRQQAVADGVPARDIYSDVLVARLLRPLALSPVMYSTRRTYDAVSQPFTGYGLTVHADDVARLGLFLTEGTGVVNGRQVLDPKELAAALQREPSDPGITAGKPDLRYNNGFWAYRTDLDGACPQPLWIPFMSGYGGISVALLPNRSVFYVFSDRGRFSWLRAAIAANRIRPLCE